MPDADHPEALPGDYLVVADSLRVWIAAQRAAGMPDGLIAAVLQEVVTRHKAGMPMLGLARQEVH